VTAIDAVRTATNVVRGNAMTIAEILAHEAPLMPLRTFFAACGIPESTGYQVVADGDLPIEVIKFGRKRYVRTVDAWKWLGLLPQDNGDGAREATRTPLAETHSSSL